MTKAEAEAECRRLDAEHPERESMQFLARESADGTWSVVQVRLPAGVRKAGELSAGQRSAPEPPHPGPSEEQRSQHYYYG